MKILAEKNNNLLVQLDCTLANGEPLYSVGGPDYITGRPEDELFKCTKAEMIEYLRKCLKGYDRDLQKSIEWHMDTRIPMIKDQQEAMQSFINDLERKGN